MSAENPYANIDMVKYPRDKSVLIARTSDVIGIGIVDIHPTKILVVWADKRHENGLAVAPLNKFIQTLHVKTISNKGDAMSLGIEIIQYWFDSQSTSGKARKLTVEDFTEVIRDARLNEPHMQKLGGGFLSPLEILVNEQKLAKIQSSGVVVPLKSIVGRNK